MIKFIVVFIPLLAGLACESKAGFYMNQNQALELAFSTHAVIKRKSVFLKPRQITAIQNKARAKVDSELVNYYVGFKQGEILGYAFFEKNIVRTMPQTFMVVLDPQGNVQFVEMLAFHEPAEYLPSDKWLDLFKGKNLDDDLWVRRGLRNITGSTLTTRAIADGVRKVIATFELVIKKNK